MRYLVDEDDQVLAQEAVTRPGGTEVDTWTWLLSDATANVGTHLDNAGAVVEQAAYDPYGKPDKGGSARASGATGPNSSLGYQSALTDKVTGAVVLGPRQYDPTTSRFTTPDTFVASGLDLQPGADELTGNRYLFAAANPVSFYDDGHGIGLPKIKLPSPLKAVRQLAKKALPFVPVVGAGIEAVSIATGRDWLEGGRKMSGGERLARAGLLAGGALLGLGATKVAGKVAEKVAAKAAAKKAPAVVAPERTVTIGRNMPERVIPYAERHGYDWYHGTLRWVPRRAIERISPRALERTDLWFNQRWLRGEMCGGSRVVDVGGPPGYRPSPFYEMERREVSGYWKLRRGLPAMIRLRRIPSSGIIRRRRYEVEIAAVDQSTSPRL